MLSIARRLFAALLVTLAASLVIGTPAYAHAELRSVSPADKSTATSAPTQVVLTFNEDIGPVGAAVTVVDGEGVSVAQGKPAVDGVTVTQPLQDTLHSGAFQVTFRVVSADGHPVSGSSTFTLNLPTATAPAASPTTSAAPEPTMTPMSTAPSTSAAASPATTPTATGSGSRSDTGLMSAIGVFLVAAAAGLAIVARKRSAGRPPTH